MIPIQPIYNPNIIVESLGVESLGVLGVMGWRLRAYGSWFGAGSGFWVPI